MVGDDGEVSKETNENGKVTVRLGPLLLTSHWVIEPLVQRQVENKVG